MKKVKEALDSLAEFVYPYNQKVASDFRKLKNQTPQQIADDLSLWGGMGSIMDQGIYGQDREVQRIFESRAIVLGHSLKELGATNPRMEQWIRIYESWLDSGR